MKILKEPIRAVAIPYNCTMGEAIKIANDLLFSFTYEDFMFVEHHVYDGVIFVDIALVYIDQKQINPIYYQQNPDEDSELLLRTFTHPYQLIAWLEGFLTGALAMSDIETLKS